MFLVYLEFGCLGRATWVDGRCRFGWRTLVLGLVPERIFLGAILVAGLVLTSRIIFSRGQNRRFIRFLGIAAFAITLLALVGLRRAAARGLFARRDTIMAQACEARLAPSDAALPTFNVPKGAIVRSLDTYGTWIKIAHDNRRGWINKKALVAPQGVTQ